jgi:hypothetical protein
MPALTITLLEPGVTLQTLGALPDMHSGLGERIDTMEAHQKWSDHAYASDERRLV